MRWRFEGWKIIIIFVCYFIWSGFSPGLVCLNHGSAKVSLGYRPVAVWRNSGAGVELEDGSEMIIMIKL